ncbi:glycosyltransferase family 9 protein [Bordetella genomosp. 9]|uniref:LPS biosynthesis glycosyltransferase n=1 Tax=Bordetella genomosp. 9 TaxID=1416803 RepID=A0A1W6YWZ3_9BORD|nr:glycosyltransferase family 9 protein [Bordetella genomosp. 9]ARP85521.1 LPS biosynthesis glycosyltransferase [Bordetella genomosp. 9]
MTTDGLWHPAPRRIAVFRALQLGDMLCAVPALRALRRHCPGAHITLIGLESARPFVQRFHRDIDELMLFPGIPAFPEQAARPGDLPAFYREAHARRFDLALQMHGSGSLSLAIVRALGARQHAGFVPDPAMAQPGRLFPWPDDLPEPLRYTALMRFLGVPVDDDALDLPLTAADAAEADRVARDYGFDPAATVFVHPGARLRSRRWPAERFGRVAAALASQGWRIAVTGSAAERELTAGVAAAAGGAAIDLADRTSLGGLAALLARAPLIVCNDTGVSHIAAAVGTRSVVVACGSDTRRWAPLDRARHTVLADYPPCRPCAHESCPIGHPCALNVSVEQVLRAAQRQLGRRAAASPALDWPASHVTLPQGVADHV